MDHRTSRPALTHRLRISVRHPVLALTAMVAAAFVGAPAAAQSARISEEVRVLSTYPFSEPNPVPILSRDPRLYPYHSFEGYATASQERAWKVVKLENDWIEVFVLPEVGGKVWGAVVKETGHEFIYRNEVMKFRNIALRGPWTSGGIEFNFGVIGHTPATATPVDYLLRENADGSVSCIVGAMDLPSRTVWRVEIRLPPDRAHFETRVLWYNPTPFEQPYYNWMTGAAFARNDLELAVPGNAYLEHSGQVRPWPADSAGRYLPLYRNNTFGSHKSYHVVGEVGDFFGGYYGDAGYGFGHWAPHEDMPGQKIWLWALSREGGVWEDLLTDTDGQYVEFQAGRLLVQYAAGEALNPVTEAGFDPLSASEWAETWFPVEGLGGLTRASREGALHLTREGGSARLAFHAFGAVRDTLRVWSGDELALVRPVEMAPLVPMRVEVEVDPDAPLRVSLPALGLHHDTDPSERTLSRPYETEPSVRTAIPPADREAFLGREASRARRYGEARARFAASLELEPWHREALLGMAELELRSGRPDAALRRLSRVLQLDGYDPRGNFLAGIAHRSQGRTAEARDALGWAARSTAYRSAAWAQLAELRIGEGDASGAIHFARRSLDYDRRGIPGLRALAVASRMAGRGDESDEALTSLEAVDPLHHFSLAERYLRSGSDADRSALVASLGGEYPDQTLLELAVLYAGMGRPGDAVRILETGEAAGRGAVTAAWLAFLRGRPDALPREPEPTFAFPFRHESLPVLSWAADETGDPRWRYLQALNLWALDRRDEALEVMDAVGDGLSFAPFLVARAQLGEALRARDPVPGLREALRADPGTRVYHVLLSATLLARGRWEEALPVLSQARSRFPADFNLALLQARALLAAGRGGDASAIMDEVRVLPSESGRESHLLYAQAHTMRGVDALERGDAEAARAAFLRALEWPERLGQGRPYDPDERLVVFLLGLAEGDAGRDAEARVRFRQVVESTDWRPGSGTPAPLDLLRLAAERALGAAVDEAPARTAPAEWFNGVDGGLLDRALVLGGVR